MIEMTHEKGHKLFGCHCGRIHVDPLGIINPTGWTKKEVLIMYGSAFALAVIGFVALILLT